MDRLTHQSRERAAVRGAEELRTRGKRMLELATRAYCEHNYDFARLLTQLATEVFTHAKDVEQSRALRIVPAASRLRRLQPHRHV